MPRAATSVATSTGRVPSRNAPSTRLRWPWLRPPWSAAAMTPCSRSWSAMRSAPSLVRQNTTVRPSRLATSAVMTFLCCGSMSRTWWSMPSTDAVASFVECVTGSVRYFSTRASMPRSSVAEKSRRWPSAGILSRLVVISAMKPISAMWSASSRTVIEMSSISTAPRSRRSLRRPGDVHERLERVGDLHRELTRRREDQGVRLARPARGLALEQSRDERQAERERLAGAGLATAEDVAPRQGVGDGRGLDGEGRGDALAGEALDDPLGQAEGSEAVVGRDVDGTVGDVGAGGLGPVVGVHALGLGVLEAHGSLAGETVGATVVAAVEGRTVVAALEATVTTVVATLVAATVAATVITTVKGRTVLTTLETTVTTVVTTLEAAVTAVVAPVRGTVLVTRGAPLAPTDVRGARRGRAGGLGAGEGTGGLRSTLPAVRLLGRGGLLLGRPAGLLGRAGGGVLGHCVFNSLDSSRLRLEP